MYTTAIFDNRGCYRISKDLDLRGLTSLENVHIVNSNIYEKVYLPERMETIEKKRLKNASH